MLLRQQLATAVYKQPWSRWKISIPHPRSLLTAKLRGCCCTLILQALEACSREEVKLLQTIPSAQTTYTYCRLVVSVCIYNCRKRFQHIDFHCIWHHCILLLVDFQPDIYIIIYSVCTVHCTCTAHISFFNMVNIIRVCVAVINARYYSLQGSRPSQVIHNVDCIAKSGCCEPVKMRKNERSLYAKRGVHTVQPQCGDSETVT